ncbi:AMP-binding protein [Nocardioides sp. CFH 31398]|uniref:AMP-binding protein n=1 Tax=Nocardioides sp. CFH 31398 TaxID=2919579 RepID=UPI001F06B987|nr:AMP-binding protein [Nocardioides sp. CFH 31398]MCH1866703.1 AMP-binding protein [Nocardioides sp. CFH 31398]
MADLPIARAISLLAAREPDAVALRADDGTTTTRRELDRLTDRVARRWVVDGVRPDALVALGCPDPVDLVLAAVATWKAGATPMPVPPGLPAAERTAVLDLAAPALVVDGPLDRAGPSDGPPLPAHAASSWKVAASSGSTGRPKLVRATAPARVDPDRAVAPFVPHRAVQLVAAPPHAGAGFVYALRGLMTGHELVLMPAFDPGRWLDLVARHRATWAVLSPTSMRAVLEHPERPAADVDSLTSVLHLGARCPRWLKRGWLDWLGPDRVDELYAGTESSGLALIGGREWLAHPGSVGRGVGGTRFRVVRADGSDCAPGETGEVLMRRDRTTYDYVGSPRTDRDGWHTLGDAGRLDAEGRLWVLDRLADVVRVDGVLVAPSDVEEVLGEHPAVRSVLAVGVEDGDGTGLRAVVETDDLDAVRRWAVGRLRPPQLPVAWETATGPLRDVAGKARRAAWTRPRAGEA